MGLERMAQAKTFRHRGVALLLAATVALMASGAAPAADADAVKRGEYVFNAADCVGCHTDAKGGGKRLAGGRPLAKPFVTFFWPSITPDEQQGLGGLILSAFHA